MSEARHRTLGGADYYRRTTGWVKGTCTWCRKPVPGRCLWCPRGNPSPCVLAFLATNSPHDPRVKDAVWRRDDGRCRGCQRDLAGALTEAHIREAERRHRRTPTRLDVRPREPWDLDHIVPVAEGGGALGMDNLQVLCRPCHRAKTAEQARRRAKPKAPPVTEPTDRQPSLFGRTP